MRTKLIRGCVIILLITISMLGVGSKEYAKASTGYAGKIWKASVKLKASKSSSSKTICKIKKGKKVTVHGTYGKWRKITYKNKTGYVPKKNVYISTKAPKIKGKSSKEKGKIIAGFAQRFKGNRYKYGRQSLNGGTDCSGFIRSVYKAFGYHVARTSSSLRHAGKKVSQKKIQAGDIVTYKGHVAMYIGKGRIVHASSPKTGIKISSNYRYRKVVSIRRIV